MSLRYVIFTTAYDHQAGRAFEVNSLDYPPKLIDRLDERMAAPPVELASLLSHLSSARTTPAYLQRVATRKGDGLALIAVNDVTHFISEDRYTYACTAQGRALVELSLADLESRLDPAAFLRIHRSAIVSLQSVEQISRWFAGRVLVKLRDGAELSVSRDKVSALRQALGL